MNGSEQNNRVVLVTGAAGGIGSALTEAIVDAGHSVAAIDSDANGLEALQARMNGSSRIFVITEDLAQSTGCAEAVRRAVSYFGRIDAVINNVGIGVSSIRPDAERNHPSIDELSDEVWDRFFAVNVRSALSVTRASVRYMKEHGWGRIINNTTSYRTMLRVLPYGATKSALESMSAVWANEFSSFGITVNVLVPGGPTDTALISDASGWPRDKLLRPRLMGAPACWLLTDESDQITGLRITACDWDDSISGVEALRNASRPIGWPELASQPKSWQR